MLTGSNLSYIGDAYYELKIRLYLLNKNITKSRELRIVSIRYVSASAHQLIYEKINPLFTDEENQVFLRGRNGASRNYRKNMDPKAYGISSGFEAIIGYLYLKGDLNRLDDLIEKSIDIIEKGEII